MGAVADNPLGAEACPAGGSLCDGICVAIGSGVLASSGGIVACRVGVAIGSAVFVSSADTGGLGVDSFGDSVALATTLVGVAAGARTATRCVDGELAGRAALRTETRERSAINASNVKATIKARLAPPMIANRRPPPEGRGELGNDDIGIG
jgi:hypothetical protein